MSKQIPYQQIKDLILDLSSDLWDAEEKEISRIIGAAPADEKQIVVAFQHTVDCNEKTPTVKTKISFAEKFTATASGSVDDPEQEKLPLEGDKGKS